MSCNTGLFKLRDYADIVRLPAPSAGGSGQYRKLNLIGDSTMQAPWNARCLHVLLRRSSDDALAFSVEAR